MSNYEVCVCIRCLCVLTYLYIPVRDYLDNNYVYLSSFDRHFYFHLYCSGKLLCQRLANFCSCGA